MKRGAIGTAVGKFMEVAAARVLPSAGARSAHAWYRDRPGFRQRGQLASLPR